METNNKDLTTNSTLAPLHQVTTVSKVLAAVLFICLPFIGGYIGYELGVKNVVKNSSMYKTLPTSENINPVQMEVEDIDNEYGLVNKDESFVKYEYELPAEETGIDCNDPGFIAEITTARHSAVFTEIMDRYEDCEVFEYSEDYYVVELILAPKTAVALLAKAGSDGLDFRFNNPNVTVAEIMLPGIGITYFDYREGGYFFTYDIVQDVRTKLDIEAPAYLANCEMSCYFNSIYTSDLYPNTLLFEIQFAFEYLDDDGDYFEPDTKFYPVKIN